MITREKSAREMVTTHPAMDKHARYDPGVLLAAALFLVTTSGAASPLRLSLVVDAPIVAGVVAEDIGAWALDRAHRHEDPCPCDPAALPWFDRGAVANHDLGAARASDWLQYGSIGAAPLLAALTDPGSPRDSAEAAVIAIEAMSVAGSTTQLLKSAIRRPRPHSWGASAMPPFAYTSFPSGHATAAFSAAASLTTIYLLRHPHSRVTPWIGASGLAIAATTAYLRVAAGRHFPSDVVAGALVGTVAGAGIPLLHTQSRIAITISPDRVGFSMSFGSIR